MTTTATTKNAWERWQQILHRIFLLLLLASAALSQLDDQATILTRAAVLLLAASLFGWYFLAVRRVDQGQYNKTTVLPAYFTVGWLLWYAATTLNPAFFLLLFALFPYVFMVAPMPWSLVLMVGLNVLVLLALNRISSDMVATWMLIVAFTSIGGSVLGYFIRDIIRQSEERQQLITELQATRESLAHSQHEAGILSERQRLAGELHDTIAQGLIGIITHLEAAENAVANQTSAAPQHLDQAKTLARSSLQETRRFIWAMRPVVLEGGDFLDGLRYSLESWSKASGLAANLIVTDTAYPLAPESELAVLRIVQEALANVARHANASQTTVTLSYTLSALLLDINDDGCGFNPAQSQERGFGLSNMRYRVEQLGGTLTIESEPNEGTTIMAHLPR